MQTSHTCGFIQVPKNFFIFICVIILILIAPSCANEAFSEIALNIQVASE